MMRFIFGHECRAPCDGIHSLLGSEGNIKTLSPLSDTARRLLLQARMRALVIHMDYYTFLCIVSISNFYFTLFYFHFFILPRVVELTVGKDSPSAENCIPS